MSSDDTSTQSQGAKEKAPEKSETDKAKERIEAKRELLATREAERLQAIQDTAAQHELAQLATEEARLDALLGTVKTADDVVSDGSNTLDLAKRAAELYASGRISPNSPIDVATATAAVIASNETAKPDGKVSAAEKKAAAAQAEADRDKGKDGQ